MTKHDKELQRDVAASFYGLNLIERVQMTLATGIMKRETAAVIIARGLRHNLKKANFHEVAIEANALDQIQNKKMKDRYIVIDNNKHPGWLRRLTTDDAERAARINQKM